MSAPSTITFQVFGEPKSKARPRFGGGHAYTPAGTLSAEREVAQAFTIAAGPYFAIDDTGSNTYKVSAEFHAYTRQRRDVDNMLKLVLDALNGKAWTDDSLVERVLGEKRFVATRSEARTVVTVEVVDEGILGSHAAANCAHCDKSIWISPSQRGAIKYCSKPCRESARVGKTSVPCSHCDTVLERWPAQVKRGNNSYCNKVCRGLFLKGKPRGGN